MSSWIRTECPSCKRVMSEGLVPDIEDLLGASKKNIEDLLGANKKNSVEAIVGKYLRCQECGSISRPPSSAIRSQLSYYEVLVPSTAVKKSAFDLDLDAVKQRYLAIQRLIHPDLLSLHSKSVENVRFDCLRRAEQWSSWCNTAWNTLRNPLKRALYLLGIDETQEELLKDVDPDTLMTVLEVREQFAEEKDVNRLRCENDARIDADIATLLESFADADRGAALAACIRLKYWYSLRDALS